MNLNRRARSAETISPGNAVNLLSPWVLEEIKVRRLRSRFVYGALAVLLLVGGGWGYQQMNLRTVESQLAGEQSTSEGLNQDIAALEPVQAYVVGVRSRATEVEKAMETEVSLAQALAALKVALPPGVTIDTASVSLLPGGVTPDGSTPVVAAPAPVDPAAAPVAPAEDDKTRGMSALGCPGPDPYAVEPSIGCMTITGTAADRNSVGSLVDALSAKDAFVEPFVSTTTTGVSAIDTTGDAGGAVTFAGTVGLTPTLFSARYDDLATQLDLQETP